MVACWRLGVLCGRWRALGRLLAGEPQNGYSRRVVDVGGSALSQESEDTE